jgi:hypothetical protein
MRGLRAFALLVLVLSLCGASAYFFGPDLGAEPGPVEIEMDAPARALLREQTRLEVRVVNRGTVPIRDVGVKINRGYANAMTVIATTPPAQIDDASTEKRLYFGELGPGQVGVYRVTMVPQRSGEVALVLRVVAARRGFDPLPLTDRTTGRSEFNATTVVLDERPATPTPPPR